MGYPLDHIPGNLETVPTFPCVINLDLACNVGPCTNSFFILSMGYPLDHIPGNLDTVPTFPCVINLDLACNVGPAPTLSSYYQWGIL